MAQIDLAVDAAPATPALGRRAFYFDSNGAPSYLDTASRKHFFASNAAWFDVTNYGLVGDGSTDNVSAWNTLYSLLPVNATVYFPSGTYNCATELAINANKQIRITGDGEQRSLIQATSAAMNTFNMSAAAAYNTFDNLGFRASVTKTAGAAIFLNNASAYGSDVKQCSFVGMFYSVYASGNLAGNASVFDDLNITGPPVNGRGIKIDGATCNCVISNTTINFGAGSAAIAGTACIDINQSGAVQIVGCDIIGGANSFLLNASGGGSQSIAAVFVSNTFFDQSGGSTVKITGANVVNRVKFVQCGITTGNVSGGSAVEIASTGTGAAGTATAAADGIDFVDCDLYPNGTTGTSNGFLISGAQGVTVQSSRISGFTNGIQATPIVSAGYTKISVQDCTIGPTNNFTTGNTVGILLNAGSFTFGSVIVTGNSLVGNTTTATDNSTVATADLKIFKDNTGHYITGAIATNRGGVTSSTTDTQLFNARVPANAVSVGKTYRVTVWGQSSSTGTLTFKIHAGAAGTISDATVFTDTTSAAQAANAWAMFEAVVQIVTIGSSGTVGAAGDTVATSALLGETTAAETLATVNTNAAWFIGVSCACSLGTYTVKYGVVEAL